MKIMDNVLVQVSGTKRIILFPPSDVDFLYMKGDKSQVLEVDNPDLNKYPLFIKAKRYECTLQPGDAIFIPCKCIQFWIINDWRF
jgi:tRNA wybutosine-synthesizing protein 5